MEVGRELLGVPLGVPLGVDDALSTLAFLALDRGVILEFKKALTGVSTSFALLLVLVPSEVLFCVVGDVIETGNPSVFNKGDGRPNRLDNVVGPCRLLAIESCF